MKVLILALSLFFSLNSFAIDNCNDADPDCSYVYNGVYCGYDCKYVYNGVYCGSTPRSKCDYVYNGVYCGVNCKYVYNGVYCADTGKATPAQPAKKQ